MSLNEKLPKGTETLKCIGLHKLFDFQKILHMMLFLLLLLYSQMHMYARTWIQIRTHLVDYTIICTIRNGKDSGQ